METESRIMSDGVQTKTFPWVPQILDDEWWKQNHITQNSLIQTTPKRWKKFNSSIIFFIILQIRAYNIEIL